MNRPMTKEESYAERRRLFKDIWRTSQTIHENDDIFSKPKVIKTLRLDEMDRCLAAKKKSQKIKNLRIVCNRLLEFCNRQDQEDMFYEQLIAQGKAPLLSDNMKFKPSKRRTSKVKKKKKREVITLSTTNLNVIERATTSQQKNCQKVPKTTISRETSPIKIKQPSVTFSSKKSSVLKNKSKHVKKKELND